MIRKFLPLAALALFASCGKQAETPAGQDAQSPAGLPDGQMRPGLWKTTMEMTRFDMPGAPAAMQGQMKSMMGQAHSVESCVSEEEARRGVKDFSRTSQDGDCTFDKVSQGAGRISGTLTCKGGRFANAMTIDGTYSPDRIEMTTSGDIAEPGIPGGKISMAMHMLSERLGECVKP